MVLKKEIIESNLKELDTILAELKKHKEVSVSEMKKSLSIRWTIERGIIAASNIVFDIADHILASFFSVYPETYEESLRLLNEKKVISDGLYKQMKGLGSFRNILVHEYIKVNIDTLHRNFIECLSYFPKFSKEILKWLNRV